MEIIDIKTNQKFLHEYVALCYLEWSSCKNKIKLEEKIALRYKLVLNDEYDNIILALGLVDNNKLLGFVSIFKHDSELRKDLSPWYATMYVKKDYRNKGYSKLLNETVLEQARNLGYLKIYLKTSLVNYYEKFGAIFIEKLDDKENLYYFKL